MAIHSSPAVVDSLSKRLCNWGRWGDDDEAGTVNFITADKVVEASRLVKTGEVVELGIELGRSGPQIAHPNRFNPLHFMTATHEQERPGGSTSADDVVVLPLQAGTQWDALAHVGHRGKMYGGRSTTDVTSAGARANAIGAVSGRIVTRGVLADVARWAGVDVLPRGHAIDADDLTNCLEAQGVEAGCGDMLLVRTGFLGDRRAEGWTAFNGADGDAPGLDVATLDWIHAKMLAGVAVDNSAGEVRPFSVPDVANPFHIVGLVYMGLLLGEIFDLDGLAQRCAEDRRYDFMFVGAPLRVSGAVGSPINPYAIR